MFKDQIKYIWWLSNLSKYLFVWFLFWMFFVNIASAFEVPLWDALDRFYDNYKKNRAVKEMYGKSVVDDIYGKSLEIVKNNQVAPIIDSIGRVSEVLNEEYDCQLNTQDMINILYFSNDMLKRDLKNNLMWFTKPNKDDMWKSCNKFTVCKYNPKLWKINNTITLNNACKTEVEWRFIKLYLNASSMQTIQQWNVGSNLFWNASMEDSSYDIMNDVYILATILFDSVKEPAETRFYKMPSVDFWAMPDNSPLHMWVDWFSPYNNYGTVTGSGSSFTSGWGNSLWSGLIVTGSTSFEDIIDADIQEFVWSMGFDVWWEDESVVWWNQCITWISFGWSEWYSSWWTEWYEELTPAEYLSGVLEEISQVSCNLDNTCQDWETTDCADCIGGWMWDTTFEEIEALLNSAQQTWANISWDNQALWCFQKCEEVPCNATSCDKIVCYAKCSCQLYESNTFNPAKNPWLTSVFKIKFCMIPVVENQISKNKTVRNIAAIYTELYNVLQNLRNSGQMAINVKTKEFMDTSLKDNSFGEQLSFSLNSTTKPTFSEVSDSTQIQEQTDMNTSWMWWILWFAKDPGLENERNKYVVLDKPCEYIVSKKISNDINTREKMLVDCKTEKKEMVVSPPANIEDALKDQKTVLLDSEFEKFLILNRDFWYESMGMFQAWKLSAEVLKNK